VFRLAASDHRDVLRVALRPVDVGVGVPVAQWVVPVAALSVESNVTARG
jgi:hypothetical protein